MDGRSQRLNTSLGWRLAFWISSVTLIIGILGALISFATAFREANELQDNELRQIGELVSAQSLSFSVSDGMPARSHDRESLVVIRRLGDSGSGNAPLDDLATNLPQGVQTVMSHGKSWRVYVRPLRAGEPLAVGQLTEVRDEVARDSAFRTLIPLLCLIPMLILVVGYVIRRSLVPISTLSRQLDLKDVSSLAPLPEGEVPREIKPFIASINRLIGRLATSIEQQRRFIADAAHELRSPITALMVQMENLDHIQMPQDVRQRFAPFKTGLARMHSLVEQLLVMARSEEAGGAHDMQPVQLDKAVREVIEDIMPLAAEKNIDVGLSRFEEITVTATHLGLTTLVRNVLHNAIAYTPTGGSVDVSLYREADRAIFAVEDTGPGIPLDEMQRVFDPFYRVIGSAGTGTGLGLSIIHRIAQKLGGSIKLVNRMGGNQVCLGLRFEYSQNC